MGTSHTIDWNAAGTAADAAFTAELNAATGVVKRGLDAVLTDSTIDDTDKLDSIKRLGIIFGNRTMFQAVLTGQPTVAPAGIGAAPAAPTPSSTTSNAADAQRVAELETALKDVASAAGVTTFPLTSGKIDAKRLVNDIDSAIKAKVAAAAAAKPATPAPATPAPATPAPATPARRGHAFGRRP